MSLSPTAYPTPVFNPDDAVIGVELHLRTDLMAVVFAHIELLGSSWAWVKGDDPASAAVQDVIAEMRAARAAMELYQMFIGEIREFATEDPPAGWLRCNGAVYANADYPLLAAVIHSGFIEDSTHFRVPQRDHRLGMDGIYPGMQDGSATHTNTLGEMYPHGHGYVSASAALINGGLEAPAASAVTLAAVTDSAGGGAAYSILNPVEGTQVYIRAAWPSAG